MGVLLGPFDPIKLILNILNQMLQRGITDIPRISCLNIKTSLNPPVNPFPMPTIFCGFDCEHAEACGDVPGCLAVNPIKCRLQDRIVSKGQICEARTE